MNFFNRCFGHQVVWCTLYEQFKFTVVSLFLAILTWYLVLVFRCYSCFVTIFWSIFFNSLVSISHFCLVLSSQWRFFSLFFKTLYWYRSFFALQFFFGILVCSYHCLVLMLRHFWKLHYFPKDSSLFTVSYFPLVLSILRQLYTNDILFLQLLISKTG